MAERSIDNLERRIELIEECVYGTNQVEKQVNVIAELSRINQKLLQLAGDRSNVRDAFAKSTEIRKQVTESTSLDQSSSAVPDVIKLKLIDADSDVIARACERLAHVDRLKQLLDSEHIKSATAHSPALATAAVKQTEMAGKVQTHTEEINTLVAEYNTLTALLNRQFVFWDQQLTAVEQKSALSTAAED